ncbi:50S ribosomal protein L2 [Candidatus Pacearchaeota archaeon CG10_big_fil_rev_8_21_14_0_10_35_13]|nr:MAG: 50S ribosomal protein L2 [Candidatus Pacearchaeota archaeon CG10_big_fil_rev_8_21_14_0_10_35_13]
MGKRIIQQARGHGSLTYRARSKAFVYRLGYPPRGIEGTGEIIKLIHSRAHNAPIAKIILKRKDGKKKEIFYIPAFEKAYVGQKIIIGEEAPAEIGNIVRVRDLEIGTKIYNIENRPGDGGKMVRAGGTYAVISKRFSKRIFIKTPSKREIEIKPECRAQIGVVAGSGRKEKPTMKAGKKYHIKKTKNKLWPRTSAVKMNVIDHPFGSGRGKRVTHGQKGKIAKRNAPAGARVGLIRPRRTGRKKR